MNRHRRSCLPWLVGALVLAFSAGCQDNHQPLAPELPDDLSVLEGNKVGQNKVPLKVMSRNVYWGGDFGLIMTVEDFTDIPAVVAAVTTAWGQFENNYFHERAAALVDEIEAEQPDFVGFQEVVQIITLDAGFSPTGVWDFVQILQAEIASRGLPYSFVGVLDNTSVVLPKALGLVEVEPGVFEPGVTEYVKFTDRLAVLVRNDLDFGPVQATNFNTTYLLGGAVLMKRGFIRVEAMRNGLKHHLVNTHLEVREFRPVQEAQTQELMTMIDDLDGVTVLLGDLNSNAHASPGDPDYTGTYDGLMDFGMADVWVMDAHNHNHDGLTCCHAWHLSNPVPEFYQRIDYVLLKNSHHPGNGGHLPGRFFMDILGEEQGDRTADHNLWPSDHAAVVASIWFPPGQFRRN